MTKDQYQNSLDPVSALIQQIEMNIANSEGDWETRRKLVIDLGEKGQASPTAALNALAMRAGDGDTFVFQSATRAIQEIWVVSKDLHEGPEWIRKFTGFLKHSDNVQKTRASLELIKATVWDKNHETVLKSLLRKLALMDAADPGLNWEIRQAAADWLGDQGKDLIEFPNDLAKVLDNLVDRIADDADEDVINSATRAIQRIWSEMEAVGQEWQHELIRLLGDLDVNESHYVHKYRRTLDLLSEPCWEDRRGPVIKLILEALNRNKNWEIRYAAADWIYKNAEDIGRNETFKSFKTLIASLKERRDNDDDPDVRNVAETAINRLRDSRREFKFDDMKNILAGKGAGETNGDDGTIEDEDTIASAIEELANQELGSRDTLRRLVDAYVRWIIHNQHPQLVELITENIRYNRFAVLPLVQYFESDPTDRNLAFDDRKPASGEDLHITNGAEGSGGGGQIQKIEAQQLVHRRIVRLLSEMSDPRFFDFPLQQKTYDGIIEELKKHALPLLVSRLPKEEDREIREYIVRTLGYISNREAVEALTRLVVGDEKERNERQSLLSTYYLEPSKNRSRQARTILKKAIEEARRTLRISQSLNIAVFFVGVALLVIGLVISMRGEEDVQRVIGALSALGGFTGMIATLIKDPLDRIQNAMGNLVQVETAFTSFIWELNLNGTYIQSRYVHQGYLDNNEIQQTARRMEDAMEKAMNLVSIHTEESAQNLVTRINRLEPSAGPAGSNLTIHGQSLYGDSSQKKERRGVLAINHIPVEAKIYVWNDRRIKFELPDTEFMSSLTNDKETMMVSLFVDGMETNALPFHLVKAD